MASFYIYGTIMINKSKLSLANGWQLYICGTIMINKSKHVQTIRTHLYIYLVQL